MFAAIKHRQNQKELREGMEANGVSKEKIEKVLDEREKEFNLMILDVSTLGLSKLVREILK